MHDKQGREAEGHTSLTEPSSAEPAPSHLAAGNDLEGRLSCNSAGGDAEAALLALAEEALPPPLGVRPLEELGRPSCRQDKGCTTTPGASMSSRLAPNNAETVPKSRRPRVETAPYSNASVPSHCRINAELALFDVTWPSKFAQVGSVLTKSWPSSDVPQLARGRAHLGKHLPNLVQLRTHWPTSRRMRPNFP